MSGALASQPDKSSCPDRKAGIAGSLAVLLFGVCAAGVRLSLSRGPARGPRALAADGPTPTIAPEAE